MTADPAKMATILGPQTSPNKTGIVFIPAALSPATSFMSLTFANKVKIITMAKANLAGKTETYLTGERRKKPAKTAERMQRLIKKDESRGMVLNLVGGAL